MSQIFSQLGSCFSTYRHTDNASFVLLTQGRVMVVKKKTAKVEAVVLDEDKLHKLIGNVTKLLMKATNCC